MRLQTRPILVAVLTYKNPGLLERSLRSLYESEDFHLMDIIVMDNNNGADETSVICSRLKNEGKIKEYFPRSLNSITGGYNQGIDYFLEDSKEYKYISFWCDDWAYTNGAFPSMLNSLNSSFEYGCATALSNFCSTSEHYIESKELLDYLRGLDGRVKPSLLLKAIDIVSKNIKQKNNGLIAESEFFCIGFLCKREMIEHVGHFNNQIVSMNDVEYSLRAFKLGYKSIIALDSYIHHIGMHAGWGKRPRKEHIDAELNDKKIFSTSELYLPNEMLLNHKFWESKLRNFYE